MFKLTLQPAPPEASVAQMFQSIPERSFGLDSILLVCCDIYLHLQLPIATNRERGQGSRSACEMPAGRPLFLGLVETLSCWIHPCMNAIS